MHDTGGDWTGVSPVAKAVGVGTEEQRMPPAVAVHAEPVLVARSGKMPDLVTSAAAHPGLKVSGAVGANVPHVTTHGAEVVHIDDQRGGRMCGGVLELRRVEGKVDEHAWGRGADCGRIVQCQTLVNGMVVVFAGGAWVGTLLALPLVLLLSFSPKRGNRDRA